MRGRFASVKERLDRIRVLQDEIEKLIIADQDSRRNGQVCWSERPQHDARLARMNEIKRELSLLQVGKLRER
jgi:hypothetical protein